MTRKHKGHTQGFANTGHLIRIMHYLKFINLRVTRTQLMYDCKLRYVHQVDDALHFLVKHKLIRQDYERGTKLYHWRIPK